MAAVHTGDQLSDHQVMVTVLTGTVTAFSIDRAAGWRRRFGVYQGGASHRLVGRESEVRPDYERLHQDLQSREQAEKRG